MQELVLYFLDLQQYMEVVAACRSYKDERDPCLGALSYERVDDVWSESECE